MVEYGLIVAGVALVSLVPVSVFGGKTSKLFGVAAGAIPGATEVIPTEQRRFDVDPRAGAGAIDELGDKAACPMARPRAMSAPVAPNPARFSKCSTARASQRTTSSPGCADGFACAMNATHEIEIEIAVSIEGRVGRD